MVYLSSINFTLMVCSLIAFAQCQVSGPASGLDQQGTDNSHANDEPQPPAIGPEEGAPAIAGLLGDRCPFPPDENGRYPIGCLQFIGDDCECIFDDVHSSMEECITDNSTLYFELVQYQVDMERERDDERVATGLRSNAGPYFNVLKCVERARAYLNGTSEGDGGDSTNNGGQESAEGEGESP